jgi:predicted nucleic acid-binding protein
MKKVFVDTLYWLAIVLPNDPWKEAANRARASLGNILMITTDEVLSEFLTSLSRGGERMRRQAVRMVHTIMGNPNVKVVAQSRDSFLKGLELYGQRLDKTYSLADCISMNVIKKESITEVLTNDKHFEQEGSVVLITK